MITSRIVCTNAAREGNATLLFSPFLDSRVCTSLVLHQGTRPALSGALQFARWTDPARSSYAVFTWDTFTWDKLTFLLSASHFVVVKCINPARSSQSVALTFTNVDLLWLTLNKYDASPVITIPVPHKECDNWLKSFLSTDMSETGPIIVWTKWREWRVRVEWIHITSRAQDMTVWLTLI